MDLNTFPHNGLPPEAKPYVYTEDELLAIARRELISRIDMETDKTVSDVVGSRQSEYELAEREALAYKVDGVVPLSVKALADAKGITIDLAADIIIANAQAWRNAQYELRAERLACKELVKTAIDMTPIAERWSTFISDLRVQVGL